MAADPPDSYTLACEQYVYWREQGLSHIEMLEAVGIYARDYVSAETTVRSLAYAHRRLMPLRRVA